MDNDHPQHAGIYWARSGIYQWWNLVVIVKGEVPFLYVDKILDFGMGLHTSLSDISEWGQEIIRPEWKP